MLQQSEHPTAGQVVRQRASNDASSTAGQSPSACQSAAFTVAPVLLNDEQAAACLGVSVRKFHDLRAHDWMPRPVVLGPRLLRWIRSELERAAVELIPRQAAGAGEPTQLLRARIERAKRTGAAA